MCKIVTIYSNDYPATTGLRFLGSFMRFDLGGGSDRMSQGGSENG